MTTNSISTYGAEVFWTDRARRFLAARRKRIEGKTALAPAGAIA